MMESNTQGHGTIKKLRTGAVISTLAISALGVSTTVSASEKEVAVNEPATRVVAKDEVKPKVSSQQDVDTAKAESDKASQDVSKQKDVVSSVEANIQTAEKTIADTNKKIEEAKAVTPEKVATAKAEADKKASELATAEKTVADAEKSVSATAEKVEDQTKVVSNAEKTATDTANKVADAQKKVDALSSTTDVAPLEKEVATLTNQVSADTQAVATAETNLNNGKKAQSNKDQAIKDAQGGVSSAESNLTQATTALASAKADKTNKDKAVTSAKSALDVAKQGVTETTTSSETMYDVPKATYSPALSDEYIKAIKALANGTGNVLDVMKAINKPYTDEKTGVSANTLGGYNFTGKYFYKGKDIAYGSEDTDKTEIVDFQHLTKEQATKLSLYAASIINDLRAKVGTAPLKVSESSVELATQFNHYANPFEKVTDGKTSPNYTKTLAEKLAMGKESAKFNLDALGIRAEGIPDYAGKGTVSTMAQLKQLVYEGIVQTVMSATSTSSSEDLYSGALSLLGFRDTDKTNLGVGLGFGYSQLGVKYETSFTLSPTKEVTTTTQKVDTKAVETAQTAYNDALKASEEAKSTVATAQTDYTDAETALANARKQLSDLVGNKIDVPSLEKALADAKDKLAQDTQALQTAKESLALAKSNATDKSKALAEAESALETAKEEQSTADQSLSTAKGELEVLTKAHDVAVLARKSAGQDLARKREASKEATDTHTVLELALTKRNEVLKALDKELTDAKSKLGVLRAELETAKEELARLEGIAEAKARVYENFKQLKADHDAYLAEQQRLQALKEKEDAIRKAGGQPKEVTDASGKVVDVVDAKVQNKAVVATVGTKDDKTYQAPAKATNTKEESKKQLPNTGTKGSMLGLLGLGLLAGLGLGYTKKNLRK